MEKHCFHRFFVDNGTGLWITVVTATQKPYKLRSLRYAPNTAGPVDLSAQAVLSAVQHGASVQSLDAAQSLEQGSVSSDVGSAPRILMHSEVAAKHRDQCTTAKT